MEKPLGIRLKKARKKKGMTLTAVADATGYSPAYICRIEGGSRQKINYQLYAKLVELYGIEDEKAYNTKHDLEGIDTLQAQMNSINKRTLELITVHEQILDSMQELIRLNSCPLEKNSFQD